MVLDNGTILDKDEGKLLMYLSLENDGIYLVWRYVIVRFVTSGTVGNVYVAAQQQNHVTVAEVALKEVDEDEFDQKELHVLQLAAENSKDKMLQLRDTFVSGHNRYLVTQVVGSNFEDLRSNATDQKLTSVEAANLCVELLEAFQQIHSLGYLHVDHKPKNVCVSHADQKKVVLVDFGEATQFRKVGHWMILFILL
ncbi:protein kinase domain-containing protein [Ditylenchus destructor]|uniref:Protein kinase domain-containing protein n=1 Tax=Ditylenchus destructor TaxID=166010 RepID=A0AAD4QWC5_9BILA|nr:protein kinase domain-containing protein [Ditylenchus destructor]